MPLTGSLLFVYICIDVGDPVEGRCWDAINYICIDVGDPVEGWCCDAINRCLMSIYVLMLAIQ